MDKPQLAIFLGSLLSLVAIYVHAARRGERLRARLASAVTERDLAMCERNRLALSSAETILHVSKARADLAEARLVLERLAGPHCQACGNPIDPGCCWCGTTHVLHDDGHACREFTPIGCTCSFLEKDWESMTSALQKRLAVVVGQRDQAVRERDEIAAERGICHDFGEFMDDLLSPERAEAFQRHLSACARCQLAVRNAHSVEFLFEELPRNGEAKKRTSP